MASNKYSSKVAKNNAKIKKTVHRRIEVPPASGGVHSHSISHCGYQQQTTVQKQLASTSSYAQPQWNTMLRQVHELEALNAQQPPHFKSTAELTPRTKAIIAPKITQKLNFNAGHTVFKNLISINVNDSILLPPRPTSIRKKYTKAANKVPVPELGDFLEPLPQLVHVIPEPDIHQEFPKHHFDYFGSYMRLFDTII